MNQPTSSRSTPACLQPGVQFLLDQLPAGILLLDENRKIVACNGKAAGMLGFRCEHLLDQPLPELIRQARLEGGSCLSAHDFPFGSAIPEEEACTVIMQIGCRPEETLWLSATFSSIPEIHRTLPGRLMVSLCDISAVKKAEARSSEMEIRFRAFMDNQPGPAWITDETGCLLYMNRHHKEIWHLKDQDCGKHIAEFMPKELVDEYMKNNSLVLDGNKAIMTFEKMIRRDGSAGISLVYKFPFPGTSFPRLIGGQSIDITDERNAEGIIQKTNERFYYVTKATSDSIWDLNIRTGQIFRSESFFRLTGYGPADIESNLDWWFSKTHPDDCERVMLEFKQCLAAGRQQWHAEYRFQCANGQYKYFSDKGFIIYEEGKPVRSIGAIQDLTEIKMLERKLREQEIQKRKQISLAVIAAQDKERNEIGKELHDNINQMLSTVRLLLSSIRSQEMEQNQVFSQCKEYLDLAIEEIRRQSKSLSSSFVREVGLKAAIQDIAKNIALSKLMQIDIDYDDSLETTLSPEQRLMACRVVQEQTNNIIRHAKASHIRIAAREQEGHLELLICDDGIGFDTKQTAHGVGLTNIRNRVEAFNGRLKLDSEPGKRCSMQISVPIR
jgi:PAS domain S-box-containing protein